MHYSVLRDEAGPVSQLGFSIPESGLKAVHLMPHDRAAGGEADDE
jgi:hypothetical protein